MKKEPLMLDQWTATENDFTAEQLHHVDEIIKKHQHQPGSLITVLEEIQETIGYLPRSIQARVARSLNLPFAEIYGVVTFYHFFTMMPRGKHTCRVCLGTACYVRGGQKNLNKLVDILHINPGETTQDQLFSLETVRCLGACGLAPAVTIDEETFPQVKTQKIHEIISAFS